MQCTSLLLSPLALITTSSSAIIFQTVRIGGRISCMGTKELQRALTLMITMSERELRSSTDMLSGDIEKKVSLYSSKMNLSCWRLF
jgi:hypothetical protein